MNPIGHTLEPIVTGTSVIALKYEGGVMLAADTLGSYGSLAKFRSLSRVLRVNERTVIGVTGDYADFQMLKAIIADKVRTDQFEEDGYGYTPRSLLSWLTRVLYNRRSQINPLWNTIVVGGLERESTPNGVVEVPFLGYVDKLGVAYENETIATGYGLYLAQPLMREALDVHAAKLRTGAVTTDRISLPDARKLLVDCLNVVYYRDARAFERYEVATVDQSGARVEGPFTLEPNWELAKYVVKEAKVV